MKTLQEVFDIVSVHLMKQGRRSELLDESGEQIEACAYHGSDGAMCAVGCLLPPELDTTPFEGCSTASILFSSDPQIVALRDALAAADLIDLTDLNSQENRAMKLLLDGVQKVHDESCCTEVSAGVDMRARWNVDLQEVAGRFELSCERMKEAYASYMTANT